jgi:murein L,D-transpeptidase YcbB/YkuD
MLRILCPIPPLRLPSLVPLTALALALAFARPSVVAAQPSDPAASPIERELRQSAEDLRTGTAVSVLGEALSSRVLLPEFYERRRFVPAWTDARATESLLRAIAESELEGLTPADYHLQSISRMRASGTPSMEARAQLELLYTDAAIRLAYHLRFGKVDPSTFDANWNFKVVPVDSLGGLVQLLETSISTGRVYEAIMSMRPSVPMYTQLRDELAKYRKIATAGGWGSLPVSQTSLKRGVADPRLPALRRRLALTGDGSPSQAGDTSRLFDARTAGAVAAFQHRHGLNEDSAVGPGTLAALNVPIQTRIDQLRLAMERLRWVSQGLPRDRFVLVNVAGFRVYYVKEGKSVWDSRVVVGRSYNKTPIFQDTMEYVVLNPTWTIPPGIMANEIRPAMRRDPGYLKRKGLTMVNGQVVQPPGDANALGRVKMIFPNEHAVYLHDTPSKSFFDRDARAFSHGCIRVQDPMALAALVLDDPAWTRDKLLDYVRGSTTTKTVYLKTKVPVLILYSTALIGPQTGLAYFYDDVYKRDAAVLKGLAQPFRFRATSQLIGRSSGN